MPTIANDLVEYAQKNGLHPFEECGGYKVLAFDLRADEAPHFHVQDRYTGDAPTSMSEPANVVFWPNYDWVLYGNFQEFTFETTRDAIDAVASPDFRDAVVWLNAVDTEGQGLTLSTVKKLTSVSPDSAIEARIWAQTVIERTRCTPIAHQLAGLSRFDLPSNLAEIAHTEQPQEPPQ